MHVMETRVKQHPTVTQYYVITSCVMAFPLQDLCLLDKGTGGHFACACVNPLNDNSVGASNLMAGNRKLAREITVLLKAISLVL